MKATNIGLRDAARHFADCVERVRTGNLVLVVINNGRPLARLVPEAASRCTGRDLAAPVGRTRLSAEEARAWGADLRAGRETPRPPEDPWP